MSAKKLNLMDDILKKTQYGDDPIEEEENLSIQKNNKQAALLKNLMKTGLKKQLKVDQKEAPVVKKPPLDLGAALGRISNTSKINTLLGNKMKKAMKTDKKEHAS